MDQTSERRFATYGAWREGLRATLDLATRTLAIFDADLHECGFERPEAVERLETFCRSSPHEDAVRILLCDPAYLERECPRLVALLARFRHRASVRVAVGSNCCDAAPTLIADSVHLVTRFHPDAPRGKICLDDPRSAAGPLRRFETLWLAAEPLSVGSALGI